MQQFGTATTIVVGEHHRVIETPHFKVDEKEERPIPGYRCLNCETWKPSRLELSQEICRPKIRR